VGLLRFHPYYSGFRKFIPHPRHQLLGVKQKPTLHGKSNTLLRLKKREGDLGRAGKKFFYNFLSFFRKNYFNGFLKDFFRIIWLKMQKKRAPIGRLLSSALFFPFFSLVLMLMIINKEKQKGRFSVTKGIWAVSKSILFLTSL
jgi:hypothetical protein